MPFAFTDIRTYHQQLRDKHTSCSEAVEHYLQAIESSRHLNALVRVWPEEALQRADELDRSIAGGGELLPLHGVVTTIKDVLCYAGHEVSAGSRMLQGFHSQITATAVQRLLDAGAIILGVNNCDEFAMGSTNEHSVYGPARNAAEPNRVPGGSSGGSAVAVQAGLSMISLGSDTGGSVRQPADFCGVVGLKPGYGRVSRYGLIAYASSFDCIGILAKCVDDVAAVYNIIAGPDPKDATCMREPVEPVGSYDPAQQPAARRFAWLRPTLELPGLDPEIRDAVRRMLGRLQQDGHTVEPVEFPLLDYIIPTYYILTTAEASSNLGRYDGVRYGYRQQDAVNDLTSFYEANRSGGFGTEVKRRILLGSFVLSSGYYDAYFTRAQQVRRLLMDQMSAIFGQYDALIMPVSPTTAFLIGEKNNDPVAMYLADIYTVLANLTGVPAMAIPGFTHSNGLPFGVQVLTNRGEEVLLHEICRYLQSIR